MLNPNHSEYDDDTGRGGILLDAATLLNDELAPKAIKLLAPWNIGMAIWFHNTIANQFDWPGPEPKLVELSKNMPAVYAALK